MKRLWLRELQNVLGLRMSAQICKCVCVCVFNNGSCVLLTCDVVCVGECVSVCFVLCVQVQYLDSYREEVCVEIWACPK